MAISRSLGRQPVDDALADADFARGDILKPGQHSQKRRLPAAGRSDEDHELAIRDLDVHALDDGEGPE